MPASAVELEMSKLSLPPRVRLAGRRVLRATGLRRGLVAWRHRGIEPGDVMIASYPRSGSTWLRFLLFQLLTGELATFETVGRDLPYIGDQGAARPLLPSGGRLIKTHETWHPVYRRAIYIVRDPRDVMASESLYRCGRGLFRGEFSRFVEEFLKGRLHGFGSWSDHVESWLGGPLANDAGCLLRVRFEELRSATLETAAGVLGFLGAEADPEAIRGAIRDNEISRMRQKEEAARQSPRRGFLFGGARRDFRHVREGAVGAGRNRLSAAELAALRDRAGQAIARAGYTSLLGSSSS